MKSNQEMASKIFYFWIPMSWIFATFMSSPVLAFGNGCRMIVDVGKYASQKCNQISPGHWQCSSLNNLDSLKFTDNTCIRILNDLTKDPLGRVLSFDQITNISISSYPSEAKFHVPCYKTTIQQKSGFNFQNVQSVRVSNIVFLGCGHPMPSYVTRPDFDKPIDIWSAFYFKYVTDLSMTGVYFNQSHGYATVLFNVKGNIEFDDIVLVNNTRIPLKTKSTQKTIQGYGSGGGIYVELREQLDSEIPFISIHNSNFFLNTADEMSATPTGSGMTEGHIGFGRGGSLSLFFLDVSHVKVNISKCHFDTNTAAWGGAIYARFRNKSFSNTINIVHTNFTNNHGTLSGGGLFSTSTQREDLQHRVNIDHCRFVGNIAEVGGAMAQKHISEDDDDLRALTISNTQFSHNIANVGSALNLERIHVAFKNVDVMNNLGSTFSGTGGQGAVYAFQSDIFCHDTEEFNENLNNAIVLDCSHLHVPGTVTFYKNIGENGGAISMYGNSFIFLYNNTDLTFQNNTAWRRGGAIYIESSGPPLDHTLVNALKFDKCFFQYGDEPVFTFENNVRSFGGSVSFIDNYASINGDSIFISSLAACNITKIGINDTISGWKNFSFIPKNRPQIITRAIQVIAHEEQWNPPPGAMFKPTIILLDQRGNHVSEQINVIIHKNQTEKQCDASVETNPRFIVTEDDTISLTLLGNNQPKIKGKYGKHCYYNVTISSAWNKVISKTLINRLLDSCHFGYTLKNKRCQCLMQKNQAKGISFCYRGNIYLYKNRWAWKQQKAFIRDDENTVTCPPGYCKCYSTDYDYGCLFNQTKSKQCIPSRNQKSKICGRCKDGWSVALGTEECIECKNETFTRYSKHNWIWILALLVIFFIAVDAIIIWLDIDIFSNYLNGFIYYCQTIILLPPSSFELWYPMKFITGIINMDSTGSFIPPFCFVDGFDNLWKALFNYLFPSIMIFVLVVIGYLARNPNSRFANVNYMKSFTIISVLAYSDFTRITFLLLNKAKLDPDEPNKLNVWIQGDVGYFEGRHIGFAVIAILVGFFIVFGFPIVLFFSYKLVALPPEMNPFRRLTTFFKYFDYCYRDDQLYFVTFYYAARVLFLIPYTFVPIDALSSTLKCLLCFVICVIFTFNEPYDKRWMNYYDMFILSNLTVVSMLCLMMRGYAPNKQLRYFSVIINVLILLPFILVTIRILRVYGPKFLDWIKWKCTKDSKPLTQPLLSKTDDAEDEQNHNIPDDSVEC